MATYDIYIDIQKAVDTADLTFPFSFGLDEKGITSYSSGFYKSVIKWCKCFLTAKGTDLSDRDYGTDIGSAVGGSINLDYLEDLTALAANETTEKILEYQTELVNATDEELITAVNILELYQDTDDSVVLKVRFENAEGSSFDASLPLKIATMGT
jgi:hypothetical protein